MLYSFDNKKPKIGKETYVSESAVLIGDVRVGNNCYIGHGVILRGDYGTIEISDGCAVEEGVLIHVSEEETCWIGKRVTFGQGAIIHSKSIGDFVVIGMGAILSMWSEIGEYSIVAEGAVVKMKQKIPGRVIVAGNPAQIIREVSSEDENRWNKWKQDYVDLARKCLGTGMQRID